MIKDYKGQKAVITGAANGIGRALALGMAKRGADVLVADIPVSYTHLDVYKRQEKGCAHNFHVPI